MILAALIAIFFVASLTRSAIGFGDALIAMPLLTLVLGLQTATPLFAIVAFSSTIVILAGSWRQVHLRDAWRLVLGSAFGIPVGLLLLTRAPALWMKTLLAVVTILVAVIRPEPRQPSESPRRTWPAVATGFVAGIFGGAYNINGPPVVIYGSLRGWTPERFRATLQGFFLPSGIMTICGHGIAGLWSVGMLLHALACLPAVLAGVAVGWRINRRIEPRRFAVWVSAALIVLGAVLLIESWIPPA